MFEDDFMPLDDGGRALRDQLNALLPPAPAADPEADLANLMAQLRRSAPAPEKDEETMLLEQDAMREALNALFPRASAVDPAAPREADVPNAPEPPPLTRDDFARLGPAPAAAPAVRDANPLSDQLTDSAYLRVMDDYAKLMRDGLMKPGDAYAVQPTDDAGKPIDGKTLHFDTRTGRATLAPPTLPPARARTPMEIINDYLNRDYFKRFKSPPPQPLFTPNTNRLRGNGAFDGSDVQDPRTPSAVFAALMRQGRG